MVPHFEATPVGPVRHRALNHLVPSTRVHVIGRIALVLWLAMSWVCSLTAVAQQATRDRDAASGPADAAMGHPTDAGPTAAAPLETPAPRRPPEPAPPPAKAGVEDEVEAGVEAEVGDAPPAAKHSGYVFPYVWDDTPSARDDTAAPATAPEPPPAADAPEALTLRRRPSTGEIIKAILGLVAILALAYLGGHPRVLALEERLQISHVVTAGFPFVVLGLIARHPSVGILSDPILNEVQPVLPLGLGWIGFAIGFRFDARGLEALPAGVASAVVWTTALPFLATVGACGLLLLLTQGFSPDAEFLRDGFILGAAGAMTAHSAPSLLSSTSSEPRQVDRLTRVIQLEELAAVLGLILVAAFFRPHGDVVGWQLPGIAWVFVTLGMGTAVGAVVYAILTNFEGRAETTVIMLGAICFTAGLASFLRLSPIAVCFIAGMLIANFPGPWKDQVRDALVRLERPVYLIFLVIAGALWRVEEWQGWALLVLFVVARLAGKRMGVVMSRRNRDNTLTLEEQRVLSVSPMGTLAIGIVVSAQDLYFGPTVPWIVTAVIGGAIVTEVIVQVLERKDKRRAPEIEAR